MIVVGLSVLFSLSPWQAPIVSVKFLSAVQAVICWRSVCSHDIPNQWMITLTCRDAATYYYTIDGRTSKQKLPACLQPSTKYTVTVTPLFKSPSDVQGHWMLGGSTTEFTTPIAG